MDKTKSGRISTKELVTLAFLGAILLAAQVAMAPLPNIEVVSLLIYIYTQVYKNKVFCIAEIQLTTNISQ